MRFTSIVGAALAIFLAFGGFTFFNAMSQVNQADSAKSHGQSGNTGIGDLNQADVSNQANALDEADASSQANAPRQTRSGELRIVFLDVGQGDAAYVQLGDHRMLIDGGNRGDSALIYSFLQREGVVHLDCVINSHPHEDHVGGLSGAFRVAQVDRVYSSVTDYNSKAFKNYKDSATSQDQEIIVPKSGDTVPFGDAEVTFIQLVRDYGEENENSLVVRIVYGKTSFLFTGDIGELAERDLVESGQQLESTVLKVGHHGSRHSSTYRFLREVSPSYSVISVGSGNTYGHPTEETLSRLRDQGTQLFRTDLQGDVTMVSDGREITVSVDRNPTVNVYVPNDRYEE